jgi:hypothetical protein
MSKFKIILSAVVLFIPTIVTAATYSASDFSMSSDQQMKSFKYKSSRGELDLHWNGRSLNISKLSLSREWLTSNQQAKTWDSGLKKKKLYFSADIEGEIKILNSSLQYSKNEEKLISDKLRTEKTKQKPLEPSAKPSSEITSLRENLRIIKDGSKKLQVEILRLESLHKNLAYLKVYNTVELLKTRPKDHFFIKTDAALYLAYSNVRPSKIINPLSGQSEDGDYWSAITLNKLENGQKTPNKILDTVLRLGIIDEGLASIELASGEVFKLKRIINRDVEEYQKLEKKFPIDVNKFSFKGEQLYMNYAQKTNSSVDVLDINLRYTGKKKNLIQITVSGMIKLFDPENKSSSNATHIGVLAASKSKLIQVKKQERINKRKDNEWARNYEKGIVKIGSTLHAVDDVDFYGWESLWYLASWMHINTIDDKKINLVTGHNVSGFSVSRENGGRFNGSRVVISRSGAQVYVFETDPIGFVKYFSFVPYKQVLSVQSIESTTTRKNKSMLLEFIDAHQLVKVAG